MVSLEVGMWGYKFGKRFYANHMGGGGNPFLDPNDTNEPLMFQERMI